MKYFGRWFTGFLFLSVAICLLGCETTSTPYKFDPLAQTGQPPSAAPAGAAVGAATANSDPTVTLLRVGDDVTVAFSDIPTPPQPISDTIKEDGSITLILNQKFQAAGKTIGALQAEIRDRYVPQFFKYLTVSIKPETRFFSVGGEVRSPNRQAYTGYMTVLRAVDVAGGFTDFANKSKVVITRATGESFTVDCKRAQTHPELDREIFPGDKIFVKKRLW